MNGQMDILTLIVVVVAVFLVIKLRSVLGRRTSDDDARMERYRAQQRQQQAAADVKAADKVVALPRRDRDQPGPQPVPSSAEEAESRLETFAGGDEKVARGLRDIRSHDPAFEPEHFMRGASEAYEMIVTAFAEGNRNLLRDFLSRDVYDGFDTAITERENRGEQVEQRFVGIDKAEVLGAEMKSGTANISVRFISQLISVTRDRAGGMASGDPQALTEVTDIWTFSRDVSTARARANPNWRLAETQSAD